MIIANSMLCTSFDYLSSHIKCALMESLLNIIENNSIVKCIKKLDMHFEINVNTIREPHKAPQPVTVIDAVWKLTLHCTLYCPGLASISLVFITSTGCVIVVAIVP